MCKKNDSQRGWDGPLAKLDVETVLEHIYVAAEGRELILWGCGWSSADTGWREVSPGVREEVTFYGGEWAWLSQPELFAARQSYPRTAPWQTIG